MKSEIDLLLKKKASVLKSRPKMWFIGSAIWFLACALIIFGQAYNLGAIFACAFTTTYLAYYACRMSKLNIELLDRIQNLQSRVETLEKR
ncbi:MAG: hypothetical protein KKG09_08955 [Verrucomicrobia bacterium]|nr:hypothetical protein [Verrucomicrobiota bacterium]MBU4291080.1 hypothetical protein [Verrucomicrobiota bacterium]MBU4498117.1 hypothetical protein [Verrucomicrobiota bacterium]MCG2680097.1 hypothetical protein [Kiritimatiellia bacterium]